MSDSSLQKLNTRNFGQEKASRKTEKTRAGTKKEEDKKGSGAESEEDKEESGAQREEDKEESRAESEGKEQSETETEEDRMSNLTLHEALEKAKFQPCQNSDYVRPKQLHRHIRETSLN
ncbi:hypothetical protein Zmor_006227 [Zophobas morio]|uniref:Uncharacterized protein n=1 Tax=Zophobas morio TaxID=2755281 RepID=A0AA38IUJ5_9CUCU|nr:hypothetical protein Zmor_006227 [Zophobas morio]